jgi:hypothetical protein
LLTGYTGLAVYIQVRAFSLPLIPAIGLAIIHGYILGMTSSYSVYGVICPKRKKWIYNGIGALLFMILAVLDRRFEMYFMTACSLLEILGSLRGSGTGFSAVMAVGMGLKGKYQGFPVAKIKADSKLYLCPLADLVPNPRLKCRGSIMIASRKGENPCEVTLYWHEYGGYTGVRNG